jgi:hypothetical protein
MKVIRHNAIGMKGEVVSQARREEMRNQPAASGFFGENGAAVVTAQRHKIDPASTIVLVFQPNMSGVEGHEGERSTGEGGKHY